MEGVEVVEVVVVGRGGALVAACGGMVRGELRDVASWFGSSRRAGWAGLGPGSGRVGMAIWGCVQQAVLFPAGCSRERRGEQVWGCVQPAPRNSNKEPMQFSPGV